MKKRMMLFKCCLATVVVGIYSADNVATSKMLLPTMIKGVIDL